MAQLKLDLQLFSGEKTEKATPKKREESRDKGQVAKSADVNTALILFASFLVLYAGKGYLYDRLQNFLVKSFSVYMTKEVTPQNIASLSYEILIDFMMMVAPFVGAAFLSALVANYIQVGFMFSTESIQMKGNRINPLSGFKRIYSLRAIVELVKSILKVILIGSIATFILWGHAGELLNLALIPLSSSLEMIFDIMIQMGLFVSVALVALSIFDYAYQKYDFEKNIRMSKQDIKDEHKKMEGDPFIKSKIKQKQREMSMRRMMQEIPNADVIITNPTHYAIALKYDDEKRDAPFIVAKGVDFVAQKIKDIANDHDIVMVENKPLARALYAQSEIGDEIPESFFKVVAEILAYVYQVKKKV
ncbi:flagellar biosynthesis protein FlhB [Priestia taiwanensis]|uniref:Flagellar biosynthetic protein FlhB n=1 Tax=Priestia taiwanensis TaxID=1347902 RepID=A0A917ENR2_9BACI|nr:flagellar biosynthesis protein FlhB [Priestia taiwanensis]MBM7362826.1 flagellar biosynthetic protein FlhB [Priestia taiwanensis]GGE65413.1 flagellar biosynthetic protein FlhB [Priestia taiwanensis]